MKTTPGEEDHRKNRSHSELSLDKQTTEEEKHLTEEEKSHPKKDQRDGQQRKTEEDQLRESRRTCEGEATRKEREEKEKT